VTLFISGLLVMGYAVAGLFFLRFWKLSRDRLFAFFAAAFWLLALQRGALATLESDRQIGSAWLYVVRLLAFLLILAAIVDKNRPGRG
jgi:hypothetical protein